MDRGTSRLLEGRGKMRNKRIEKKWLITFTLALISTGVLAACSGKELAVTSVEETSVETIPVENVPLEEITSVREESSEERQAQVTSEVPAAPDADEFSSLLSGGEGAKISLEKNAYYLGDQFAIWMEKGVNLPENLPQMIEDVMADEEEILGIRYADRKYAENGGWFEYYFGDDFQGIDYPVDKVNILLRTYKGDGAVEWADTNEILLFDETGDETVYHELAHVLRLGQSPKLGQVLEEGIANYAQWKIANKRNTPCWDMIQYVNSDIYISNYDDAVILKDPEQAFREANLAPKNAEQIEYQYGIRFITFLTEAYGPDVIKKLGEAAAKRSFSEDDNDAIIEVIREATSEDVFEQFGKWLPNGWRKCSEDIINSLKPYGL